MNGPDLHSRRAMLVAAASTGTALLAGCLGDASPGESGNTTATTQAPATDTPEDVDYGGFLNDAQGWNGPGSTVDRRGESELSIGVGVGENEYAFDPVAVRIDPGTTVRWEWESPGHNVRALVDENLEGATPGDPLFESSIRSDGTFEWTAPDVDGVVPYVCEPHEGSGMKGALAIGDVPTTTDPTTATPAPEDTPEPVTEEPPETSDPWDDDFDGALADTENYDGTVADETDTDSVTVEVGAGWGDEDQYGFTPPAVRVTAGTTIEWVWRSSGHNVHATAGAEFESIIQTEGDTFEWVVPSDLGSGETTGTATETATPTGTPDVVEYQCDPHAGMGMVGVIVVE
ncbi:plastocyanin/azurin family copper-binding protein [Halomarina rubra]|uniref:Plastocyanin/azurin family copper-binding protein n=1 Tax=Halomarina rubra TaxID=2071873 RepID=A0ABD6B1Y2_9EURY|nr:plastocyanin/azurin family copper-binding protein [Halomarina rubra]